MDSSWGGGANMVICSWAVAVLTLIKFECNGSLDLGHRETSTRKKRRRDVSHQG